MFYQRFMQALLEIPVPNGCISELGDRTVKMRPKDTWLLE